MAGFIPHTEKEVREMLGAAGAESMEALFKDIPEKMRPASFNLPPGKTEYEALKSLEVLAGRNRPGHINFLGGGYYDHFIPAAVDSLTSRAEFFTAYTPYQPEASQGTLRAIFEYQTMTAGLAGLDYANASLYDGGTALYEAIVMALRANGRDKIIIDSGVNPLFRKIIKTCLANTDVSITETDAGGVYTDKEKIKGMIDDNTSAVVVQNPNFFGIVDDYSDVFAAAKEKKALSIISFYPLSLGLLKTPGEMGADIATAEGQSMGMELSFGGPYLGVMAASKKYVRKMPGRIVGETVDRNGKESYVLTLQAREQHIRREKATSNICSNQALCSLRAAVYLSLLGKEGLRETAALNTEKAYFLMPLLDKIKGVEVLKGPVFNEFPVRLPVNAFEFVKKAEAKGYLAGLPAGLFYEGMDNVLIVAATEKRNESEMAGFAKMFEEVLA